MIDWQALTGRLAEVLGRPLDAPRATSLAGGDINRAFRLDAGRERFFVKLNRAEREAMFVAERAGLDALRASATIRAPRAYLVGRDGAHAYIVMEFIELAGRPAPERLAADLAALHGSFAERFGFDCDNTIGSTPQPNAWRADWVGFWREQRLGQQLELGARNGLDATLLAAGARLQERLEEFFAGYHPRPALLHGDLWSGNQGADAQGNPVIYDPACYYGDHETDLAMMELFGHPGERFFAAYRELRPIDPGYARRRDLYNLYHVLNHANLFGGGYAAQAARMIDGLLAGPRAPRQN